MEILDGLTPEEQRTADLVDELTRTGNLHPLVKMLRSGEAGPERARDALQCSESSTSHCSSKSPSTR
jgi:hypothetical protein